jgi:cysteine desulfurase
LRKFKKFEGSRRFARLRSILMDVARTYLDHNASAPLLPEARDALRAAFELTGNPSSVHAHGRALRAMIDEARAQVAQAAGATREQVVFTGSATEAITQAIVGGAKALGVGGIVVSAGEHAAVLKAAEATGLPVITAGLDPDGVIRIEEIAAAMTQADQTGTRLLVAVHAVNNETGVIQPIDRIDVLVGASPHYLFVDAVQAFGKLALDFSARAPDMMAVSAHKIGGPQGIGALLMKGHADQVRLIPGGGQETGRRGGTEAAALIAGFGAAATSFADRYREAAPDELVRRATDGLMKLAPEAMIFGAGANRIGNTLNFAVPGLKNSVAMMALDLAGVSVSSGSACSSGKVGPSHVLKAMGISTEAGEGAMRLSTGWNSTREDIDRFLEAMTAVLNRHRERRSSAGKTMAA